MNSMATASAMPTPDISGKPCVLFVDDEERILNTMRILFRRKYEVLTASGGEQAVEIMRKHNLRAIVSDQRMPGMSGYEVLREARRLQPKAMRILLTGYSDLNAILGSINEGEVFRFINKPWSNDHLMGVVDLAVQASQHTDVETVLADEESIKATPPSVTASTAVGTSAKPGVLILDEDAASIADVKQCLESEFQVYQAGTLEAGLDLLGHHRIGVLITETHVGGREVTALLGELKHHYPQIVSIVLTNRNDADTAIALINQGQIFRFLIKPTRAVMCQLAVRAAQQRFETMSKAPSLAKRFEVESSPARAQVSTGLLQRIQQLRGRFTASANR